MHDQAKTMTEPAAVPQDAAPAATPVDPAEAELAQRLARLDEQRRQLRGRESVEALRRYRALSHEFVRLRSCNALWKAAEPLLRNTAAALGLAPGEAMRSTRLSALLALPALCRRDGILVRFSGTPRTDGRTIWLGTVDLSHPAAPVYVFGHGIHERCHVVHTDFGALAGLGPMEAAFTNLFEDVRVDALGEADCRGYRLWRQALLAILVKTDCCALLAQGRGASAADVLRGWLHAELIDRVLGITLPEGVLGTAARTAKRRFGADFCARLLGLVLGRMPLGSTAGAVALAREVALLLKEAGREEWMRGSAGDRAPEGRGTPHPSRRAVADEEAWSGVTPLPDESPAMAALSGALVITTGGMPDPAAVEEAWEKLRLAGPSGGRGTGVLTGLLDRADSPLRRKRVMEAFDNAYADLSGFAMRLGDALRRRVPAEAGGFASGFDVDDAFIDRAVTGDSRIFLASGRETGRECVVEVLADISGSLGLWPGAIIRATAARLEEALRRTPGVRCRTAVFPDDRGGAPALVSNWRSTSEETCRILRALPSRGPTPVSAALLWGLSTLAGRSEAVKLLVILTDGIFDAAEFRGQKEALGLAGIETATVILRDPDMPEGDIAPATGFGRSTRLVRRPADVPDALLSILHEWRRRGVLPA